MDLPIPPLRPKGPALGRRSPANDFFIGPNPGHEDDLKTNVPPKPKVAHIPVLSNRGGGVQWNRQASQVPKPPKSPVILDHGNFVVDLAVPYTLLKQVPHSNSTRDEFNCMRYSAVTCDPSDFYEQKFTLRSSLFARPRTIEIMIVVTIYNEDDILFARTLREVLANIKYLTSRGDSTWDKSSWKKVVVCIISDGRNKINPRTRALLTLLGAYQEGTAKRSVEGKDVLAHLYEYTTQLKVEVKSNTVKVVPTGAVPCQLVFCLKERNQKKLNSHRWALQAFGRILNPKICIFIDAGTEPGPASFFHLWKAFDEHPSCGSVSGVTKVHLDRHHKLITNPLLAAQNFEYKLWNVLDRPFDSLFGLRFDMPGAMLAHRFVALQNDKYGDGPLRQYFSSERYTNDTGSFAANMALTEDRALSFALVTKRNCHWDLKYEYAASAAVDVPEALAEYVLQQRRWFNGNLFGSIYAISHIKLIFRSSHSVPRKLLLVFQCIYQSVALLYSWFSIGNLFLIFHILTTNFVDLSLPSKLGTILVNFLDFSYVGTLFVSFIFGLAHSPRDIELLSVLVVSWSIIMLILMSALGGLGIASMWPNLIIVDDSTATVEFHQIISNVLVPLFLTYGFWLILALMSGSPTYILNSIIQYILLLPVRINISNLYAFCNIHDISWGTKGSDVAQMLPPVRIHGSVELDLAENVEADYDRARQLLKTRNEQQGVRYWEYDSYEMHIKRFRTLVMASWAFTNGALVFIVLMFINLGRPNDHQAPPGWQNGIKFVGLVLWSFAMLTGTKFAGAMYYFVRQRFPGSGKSINSQKKKNN